MNLAIENILFKIGKVIKILEVLIVRNTIICYLDKSICRVREVFELPRLRDSISSNRVLVSVHTKICKYVHDNIIMP